MSVDISRNYRDALRKIAAIEDSTLFKVLNEIAARRIQEWEKQHGIPVLRPAKKAAASSAAPEPKTAPSRRKS